MMLHTQYQGSKPYGFRQEDFFMLACVKYVTPGVEPFLVPGIKFEQT